MRGNHSGKQSTVGIAVLAAVAVAVWALLLYGQRRRAVRRVTVLLLGVGLATWGLIFVLMAVDPTGAGGIFDCWPSCSTLQKVISIVLFVPPVIAGALLLGLVVLAVTRRIRAND